MLSKNDAIFQEAGATMYELSEDERMQQMLETREDARRNESSLRRYMWKRIDEATAAVAELDAKRDALLAQNQELIEERDAAQAERDAVQAERDTAQAERDAVQAERDAAIAKQAELQKMVNSYREKYGSL